MARGRAKQGRATKPDQGAAPEEAPEETEDRSKEGEEEAKGDDEDVKAEETATKSLENSANSRLLAAGFLSPGKEPGNPDANALDKTVVIEDPLSEEQRQALTRVRQHEEDVAALRSTVDQLRKKNAQSSVEIRRVCDEATRVEELLGVSPEVLSQDALQAQAEWPAQDLAEARELMAAVDACEAAMQRGRAQISLNETAPNSKPEELCDALESLLTSFVGLKAAQAKARSSSCAMVCRADLGVEGRARALRPLADALLDKAVEVHGENGGTGTFAERAREVLQSDSAKQVLELLGIEVPSELLEGAAEGKKPQEAAAVQHLAESPAVGPAVQSAAEQPPVQLPGMGEVTHLWHAVHVGDLATVKAFVDRQACDGKLRDASGHSVLWHALAFNHMSLAKYMLDTFPPGTTSGIEVDEMHRRRGDTLLHLLCMSKSFGPEAAGIFKRLAAKVPAVVFQKVNQAGYTFFQIAASALNFWVLSFVLKNFEVQAKALVCMPSNPAMRSIVQAISPPTAPVPFEEPQGFPEHFHLAEMLRPGPDGIIPYADVAFDVGPDREGVASGRFLAHRIVVTANSPVLFKLVEKTELKELQQEKIRAAVVRIDARISQDVWRNILQFMYTGSLSSSMAGYGSDVAKCSELLRACILYDLPKPLLAFAQNCLYQLLPRSPPTVALQVFSMCAGDETASMDELCPIRDAAAYIILQSAHKLFEQTEASDTHLVLERVIQSVEQAVFKRSVAIDARRQQMQQDALSQSLSFSTQCFPRGIPQDILSQSLSFTRNGMPLDMRAVPQDMLSQSLSQSLRSVDGYGLPPSGQFYGRA
eukprot:TRINITY_DN58130_c0_g1_i1.p1 TRINITY_DN58130_c0_g1~~TRINITY_DN58130_c0_g1_i1.p1  ORF type:complete len:820 (-),score=190.00 TRINITY_DN58130_c0_g1_i1:370-2829(-)